ncbi:HEPN domain-containing protein [Candidatus Daviesbacteria bacterium]|nr:HEPN domain-containing protein [Candidatus Daviesbacteria bacterium]
MDNDFTREKYAFIVAFVAALFAFTSFKTELSLIIIDLGIFSPNLLQLMIVFLVLLSLSIYFFAFDSIRYRTRIQNSPIFRIFIILADVFYVMGIVFPLFILLLWITNVGLNYLLKSQFPLLNTLINIVVSLITAFITLFISKLKISGLRDKYSREIEIQEESQLERAKELFDKKFYSESILEAYKVIELVIRKELEKKGYRTIGLPTFTIIESAVKSEIIDKELLSEIEKLRLMRNKASHFYTSFNSKDAKSALDLVEKILNKIT